MKLGKLKDEEVPTVMTVKGAKREVFEYILKSGPTTVYDIKKDLKMEQPNVFRILKRLLEENSVMITETEYTSRKRKYYGPTLYGLMNACGEDERIIENFDGYYSKWIVNDGFRRSVQYMMRDEDMKKDPEKAMKILLKYLNYVLDSLKTFDEWKSKLPVELQVFFGEMLMMMVKPEETTKRSEEFYKYIIPFKANAQAFLNRAVEMKKEEDKKNTVIANDNKVAEKFGKNLSERF